MTLKIKDDVLEVIWLLWQMYDVSEILDLFYKIFYVVFFSAGLNGSPCPALSAAIGCCEGTSSKLHFWNMVSTWLLSITGRDRWLSSGSWDGGSSLGLDGKPQPDVTRCGQLCGPLWCSSLAKTGGELWITSVSGLNLLKTLRLGAC